MYDTRPGRGNLAFYQEKWVSHPQGRWAGLG
ncbi:MAG: hypothetical protein QOD01_1351 [Actinomycetota bacterium]|jgi:hypothetical protein|nr:hypothetical protein [Actinomycetota bacterium]